MELGENTVKIIGFRHFADAGVNFCKTMQNPALKRRHLGIANSFAFRKSVERPKKVAQRIAEATIVVGCALDDFRPNPKITVIVRADHP